MSCNCATSEQIKALHDRFGVRMKPPKSAKLSYKINFYITSFFASLVLLTTLPLMFHYIGRERHNGVYKFSISNFMGLRKGEYLYG